MTIIAHISPNQTTPVTNTATVTGPEPDPNPANNTSSVTNPAATSADLAITKTHLGPFVPGSQGTYQFTVVNNGPSDAAAPIRVSDQLPPELTFVSASSPAWTCTANAANLVTCDLAAPLSVGAIATLQITVAISPAHTGDIVNTATVASPTPDPHQPNNSSSDTTASTSKPTSHQQAPHRHRDRRTTPRLHPHRDQPRTLRHRRTGHRRRHPPTGMTYLAASGTGWACTTNAQNLTCTAAGGVAAGTSLPNITVRAQIAPDAGPAVLTNHASVNSPAPTRTQPTTPQPTRSPSPTRPTRPSPRPPPRQTSTPAPTSPGH